MLSYEDLFTDMFGVKAEEEQEMNRLISERDELRSRKAALLAEIENLKEKESLAVAQSLNRSYRKSFFRRIPLGWLDSVYCTRRDKILKHISSTLSTYDMRRDVKRLSFERLDKCYRECQYYAVICEAVINTPQGVVLSIRDPYRKMHTQPLKNTSIEQAERWVNSMLVVKAHLTEDQLTNDELQVERIKLLKYTRNSEKKEPGVYEKIPSFLSREFEGFRGVYGYQKCLDAEENIYYVLKSRGWEIYTPENKLTCYIKNGYRCRVITGSDILEILWEDNVVISETDRQLAKNGHIGWSEVCGTGEYNGLINSEICMCFEPDSDDI